MWFTGYISKLRLVSEAYLTLVVVGPIFMIVVESCRLIMGKGSIQTLKTIVYVLIPVGIAVLILLLHASSPEKFVRRKGMSLTLLPLLGGFVGVAAGFKNPELFGIAGAIVGSLVATLFLYRLTSEEDRVSKALPVFLNRVVALMEAEKDFTTAFRIAARDEPNPLGKYVRTFAEMVNLGVPRHKAFLWLQNATAVPDLKMIAHVLGSIVNVSGRVRETMLALLGEMNRIIAFRKERISVTRMHVLVMIMAFLVYLGISTAISTMLFTQISKLSVSGSVGIFSPNTAILGQIKTIMRHAGYIIAAATAAGIGAAKGDMRRSMPYLAGLLSIAFAVGTMFLQGWVDVAKLLQVLLCLLFVILVTNPVLADLPRAYQSDDVDINGTTNSTNINEIAKYTDIIFLKYPSAVSEQNRRFISSFPSTSDYECVVPEGVSTKSKGVIRDAYIKLIPTSGGAVKTTINYK